VDPAGEFTHEYSDHAGSFCKETIDKKHVCHCRSIAKIEEASHDSSKYDRIVRVNTYLDVGWYLLSHDMNRDPAFEIFALESMQRDNVGRRLIVLK
jgi:hypothetical protein